MRIRRPWVDARAPAALMSTGQRSRQAFAGKPTATMGQKTRDDVEERMSRFGAAIALVTAVSAALWPGPSPAQEPFPSRTVKIVVPAAPGSTTDTLARIVADQLSQKWGKAAVVENVPGGAMNIGAGNVARAAPDGYTLLVAPPSPLSFNHLLFRELGYEPTKFVPITMLAKIPNVLVGPQGPSGVDVEGAHRLRQGQSRQAVLRVARRRLDRASVGGAARSAGRHQDGACALSRRAARAHRRRRRPCRHVLRHARDLGPALPRRTRSSSWESPISSVPPSCPEVPTFSEAGLPGFRSITWFGLVAPPGTPAALAEKINRDVVEILHSKEVADMLRRLARGRGDDARPTPPTFFADETACGAR